MNNAKAKELRNTLNKLEGFIKNKECVRPGIIVDKIRRIFKLDVEEKVFTESEILSWVADSVSIFTELNVGDAIIANFLDFFKFRIEENDNEIEKRIGPFVTVGKMSKEYWPSSIVDFNYARIAFECAKKNLDKIENDSRLVPKYLSNSFKDYDDYKQIGYILESIEDSYSNYDAEGIITKSFNLVEEVLNIDENFKKSKVGVKDKLKTLVNSKELLEKFGVDIQIVDALNNFRVIRNKKVVHNNTPIRSSIPMISAVSVASLSVLFLEIVFANNKMIKND